MTEKFERLKNNIIDMIAEEQAKLGYMKESVRLYYPLESLRHLTGTEAGSGEMPGVLAGFVREAEAEIGRIEVSQNGERFCFICSKEVSEYVHENYGGAFIYELINLLTRHGISFDDIIALFKGEDADCIVESVDNGEFHMMIRFSKGPDEYYYCFKDEGGHIIYHRFLPEDYKDFGF